VNINWQLYQKLDRFTLREAATFWLEVPLNSEDPQLEIIERLINKTLVEINLNFFKEEYKEVVRTDQQAYDLLLTKIALDHLENNDPSLYSKVSRNPSLYSIEDVLHQKILYATPTHIGKIKRSDKEFRFKSVYRNELIEVANMLDQKPKFLFPNLVQDKSQTLTQNISDKPPSTKERNSYLKLIKGILKEQGLDPGERGIAKELSGMVDRAGQSLGQDKIRGILKEIQELE
jgi:hypothetical protein